MMTEWHEFSEDDVAQANAAAAAAVAELDRHYRRRHPSDNRSPDQRVEEALQADTTGVLPLDMAVCPYCGTVPDLNENRGYCCKLYRWLGDSLVAAEYEEFYARLEAGDPEAQALWEKRTEQEDLDPAVVEAERRNQELRLAEDERRMEEIYGVEVVREARRAQRAFDAQEGRDREARRAQRAFDAQEGRD